MYVPHEALILLGNVAMALWGAIVRYLFYFSKRPYSGRLLLGGIVGSIFMGIIVFLSYPTLGLEYKISFVVSGLLGYTGPDALDIARRLMLLKLGVQKPKELENEKSEMEKLLTEADNLDSKR
jgi:hypothetical protein